MYCYSMSYRIDGYGMHESRLLTPISTNGNYLFIVNTHDAPNIDMVTVLVKGTEASNSENEYFLL